MKDVSNIDWKAPYSEIKEGDPSKLAKQKVFFLQDGIEYDAQGKACNVKQVKDYYAAEAKKAQEVADAAKAAAEAASAAVTELNKAAKGK